jgi:hypothetical protein
MSKKKAHKSFRSALSKGVDYVYYDPKNDRLSVVSRGDITSRVLEEGEFLFHLYRNKVYFKYMRAGELVYVGVL